MSYFVTSDGAAIEQNKAFDGGGGDIELIPNNTSLLAAVLEAKWAQYDGGDSYINVKWQVMLPMAYKGRIVFQKIKVNDKSTKTADKAKNMLVAIDMNAGGHLVKAGKEPTDESLSKWLMSMMMIQCMVWEIKTEEVDGVEVDLPEAEWKSGNWIRAVNDAATGREIIAAKEAQQKQEAATNQAAPPRQQARPQAQQQAAPPQRQQQRPAPQQQQQQVQQQQVQQQQPDPAPDFDSFDDDIPF